MAYENNIASLGNGSQSITRFRNINSNNLEQTSSTQAKQELSLQEKSVSDVDIISRLTEKFGEEVISASLNEDGTINKALLRENLSGVEGAGFGRNRGSRDPNAIIPQEKLALLTEKFGADIIAQVVPNENGEITFEALGEVLKLNGIERGGPGGRLGSTDNENAVITAEKLASID